MGNNELVELSHDGIQRETPGAILYDFGTDDAWIPRSLLTEIDNNTIAVPEWFAIKEGLV